AMQALERLLATEEGRTRLAAIKSARQAYVEDRAQVMSALARSEHAAGVERWRGRTAPLLDEYLRLVRELGQHQEQEVAWVGRQASDPIASAIPLVLRLTAVAIALGAVLAWLITRSITRPLAQAVAAADALAEGDLTARIDHTSRDEVGQLLSALQRMAAKLGQIIGEVRASADTLASASEEVNATSQSLSQASSEQAASVEETTAAVEQMGASIAQNSANAQRTDTAAAQAAAEAAEGGEAVAQTVAAMRAIAEKLSILDDIAYQTNLLALNAAIEAAR